jgi:RNA polymerase sigma-70 factor (ECF subfamily)
LPSEEELVLQFSQGDESAFRQLFDALMLPLCYFGRQLTEDKEEAEDIASLAFHKLWERREGFSSMPGIRSFLYTTVRNHCLNYLKHRKVVTGAQQQILYLLEKEEAWAEARFVQADVIRLVYAEIEALPSNYREIIRMSFIQGLDTQEIAALLHLTESHVRVSRSRAIMLLRTALIGKNLWGAALLYWVWDNF